MAQVLEGKPHIDKMSEIDLHELNKTIRLQRIIFLATKDVYDSISPNWKGNKEFLLIQIVKLVGEFIDSKKVKVVDVPKEDALRIKMTILFNMQKVVAHVCRAIIDTNVDSRKILLDSKKPIKSTSDMRPWSTKKPAEWNKKSHINLAVYDSGWEINSGQELERNKHVISWVRNDHIGFGIKYLYNGITHDYWPDFLIRLDNDVTLVLEIKGVDDNQNKEKRRYLEDWIDVVNENGNFGTWSWDVAFHPSEVRNIIEKHATTEISSKVSTKCPKCGKSAKNHQDVQNDFGFRNMNGIVKPQSWCRICRKK